jgi:hypothetical protein
MQARFLDQVFLPSAPPTREEIFLDRVYFPPDPPTPEEIGAVLFSWVDWLVARDAMLCCPCAFADDPTKCLRELRLSPLRYRPRVRARRRQRRGARSCERGPPGGDDGGDGDGPAPPRLKSAYGPRAEVRFIPPRTCAPPVLQHGRAR